MTDNTPPPPPQQSEMVKTTLLTPSLYGGRFTRKQYFLYMLVGGIIFMILSWLLGVWMISAFADCKTVIMIVELSSLIIAVLAAIFFFIPVAVKREHDIGHKGTFTITLFSIWLIVRFLIYVSIENYETYIILYKTWGIATLIYGCFLLFKDSQKGTNAYDTSAEYRDTQSEIVKTTLFTPSLYGGRFTRKQYFWHLMLGFVGLCILLIISSGSGLTLGIAIFALILYFPPVIVKRAHDIGHKGTFAILLYVASLLTDFFCFYNNHDVALIFSTNYNYWTIAFWIVSFINSCYSFILLFMDSERGTNAYGSSTKYPNTGLPKLFTEKSLASGKNRHCVKKVKVNDSAVGRPCLQKSKVEVPVSGSISLNQLKANDK